VILATPSPRWPLEPASVCAKRAPFDPEANLAHVVPLSALVIPIAAADAEEGPLDIASTPILVEAASVLSALQLWLVRASDGSTTGDLECAWCVRLDFDSLLVLMRLL
jgi:hypothetical protein